MLTLPLFSMLRCALIYSLKPPKKDIKYTIYSNAIFLPVLPELELDLCSSLEEPVELTFINSYIR